MRPRPGGKQKPSATFEELLAGDFGELADGEGESREAAIVINVASGRCRVFRAGAAC